jgi:hypothetical protein
MAERDKGRALSDPATSHFSFNSSPSRAAIYGKLGGPRRLHEGTTPHCLLFIPIQSRLEILDGDFAESEFSFTSFFHLLPPDK